MSDPPPPVPEAVPKKPVSWLKVVGLVAFVLAIVWIIYGAATAGEEGRKAAEKTIASIEHDLGRPTPAPALTGKRSLTSHELVACGRWAEMLQGKHQGSVGEMLGYVQASIANQAWVDAEHGPVHTAALAVARDLQSGADLTTAGRQLNTACGLP